LNVDFDFDFVPWEGGAVYCAALAAGLMDGIVPRDERKLGGIGYRV